MEHVRPAGRHDLGRLRELGERMRLELGAMRGGVLWCLREAAPEPLDETFDAAIDHPDGILLVGTIDDVPVGYALARVEGLPDATRLGRITDLYVEPEAREVGVGEAILAELLARFDAAGCRGVDAVALPGNRAVKNFFEEQGFTARLLQMHRPARAPDER